MPMKLSGHLDSVGDVASALQGLSGSVSDSSVTPVLPHVLPGEALTAALAALPPAFAPAVGLVALAGVVVARRSVGAVRTTPA